MSASAASAQVRRTWGRAPWVRRRSTASTQVRRRTPLGSVDSSGFAASWALGCRRASSGASSVRSASVHVDGLLHGKDDSDANAPPRRRRASWARGLGQACAARRSDCRSHSWWRAAMTVLRWASAHQRAPRSTMRFLISNTVCTICPQSLATNSKPNAAKVRRMAPAIGGFA